MMAAAPADNGGHESEMELGDWRAMRRPNPRGIPQHLPPTVQAPVDAVKQAWAITEAMRRSMEQRWYQEVAQFTDEASRRARALVEDDQRRGQQETLRSWLQRVRWGRSVTEHARSCLERREMEQAAVANINSGILQIHQREQKRFARESQARLEALRSNNLGAYLKLAQKVKDGRIQALLAKTAEVIDRMCDRVQMTRDGPGGGGGGGAAASDSQWWREAAGAGGSDEDPLILRQRMFYKAVHRVDERVAVQPPGLRGGTLRPYQMDGLRFLSSLYVNGVNGMLADDMGLGKTVQVVALLTHLRESQGEAGPHLILAPKAVLSNWAKEFQRWLQPNPGPEEDLGMGATPTPGPVNPPALNWLVYDGRTEDRRALQARLVAPRQPGSTAAKPTFNVLITHYDLALRDKSFLRRFQWGYLVVDEGHRLKNSSSKLTDVLKTISFNRRLLLTGTPVQNSVGELWNLLNFLLPTVFASDEPFDKWFAAPLGGGPGAGATAAEISLREEEELLVVSRLQEVIRPFVIRRTKTEVESELPAKTEAVIRCGMSEWQSEITKQIASGRGPASWAGARASGLNNVLVHLRKACNHPFLFLDRAWDGDPRLLVTASGKFFVLHHILPKLHRSGHRVLLFSQMTKVLDLLEDYLVTMTPFSHLRLDGGTKTDDRAQMIEDFNAENSPHFIFLLSTRAGGLGLNLQSADTVILFDSDWNPQMDAQAQDRAHRIGQRSEVRVITLVSAGTVEEAVLGRAEEKKGLDIKLIQAGLFNQRSTHEERQRALTEALGRVARDGQGEGVHSIEDTDVLLARDESELAMFRAMTAEVRAQEAGGAGAGAGAGAGGSGAAEREGDGGEGPDPSSWTPHLPHESTPWYPGALMGASELPEWVKGLWEEEDRAAEREPEPVQLGLGGRPIRAARPQSFYEAEISPFYESDSGSASPGPASEDSPADDEEEDPDATPIPTRGGRAAPRSRGQAATAKAKGGRVRAPRGKAAAAAAAAAPAPAPASRSRRAVRALEAAPAAQAAPRGRRGRSRSSLPTATNDDGDDEGEEEEEEEEGPAKNRAEPQLVPLEPPSELVAAVARGRRRGAAAQVEASGSPAPRRRSEPDDDEEDEAEGSPPGTVGGKRRRGRPAKASGAAVAPKPEGKGLGQGASPSPAPKRRTRGSRLDLGGGDSSA